MNPRTVCFCQPVAVMISSRLAPFLRLIRASTCSFLVVPAVFGSFAALADLGALVAFAFAGLATLAAFSGVALGAFAAFTEALRFLSPAFSFVRSAFIWSCRASSVGLITSVLSLIVMP